MTAFSEVIPFAVACIAPPQEHDVSLLQEQLVRSQKRKKCNNELDIVGQIIRLTLIYN
jgi:hypothetical protein